MIKTNARGEVTIPFFVAGQEEPDLQAILDALAAKRG